MAGFSGRSLVGIWWQKNAKRLPVPRKISTVRYGSKGWAADKNMNGATRSLDKVAEEKRGAIGCNLEYTFPTTTNNPSERAIQSRASTKAASKDAYLWPGTSLILGWTGMGASSVFPANKHGAVDIVAALRPFISVAKCHECTSTTRSVQFAATGTVPCSPDCPGIPVRAMQICRKYVYFQVHEI